MNNFLKIILGAQPFDNFAGYMVLALIGIIIKLLLHVASRNQASPNTPTELSISFMLKDNAIRLLASLSLSLFVVFVCVRFTDEILHVALSPFIALGIGLGSDYLAEKLKDFSSGKIPFTTIAESVAGLKNTDDTITNLIPKVEPQPEQAAPALTAGTTAGDEKIIDQTVPAIEQVNLNSGAAVVTSVVDQLKEVI